MCSDFSTSHAHRVRGTCHKSGILLSVQVLLYLNPMSGYYLLVRAVHAVIIAVDVICGAWSFKVLSMLMVDALGESFEKSLSLTKVPMQLFNPKHSTQGRQTGQKGQETLR